MKNVIRYGGDFIYEFEQTEKKTRLKKLIEEMYGSYDVESIEEISSVIFASKNDVMRLAEDLYDLDVGRIIELSKWFSVSIDYLLGQTDCKEPYPRKE